MFKLKLLTQSTQNLRLQTKMSKKEKSKTKYMYILSNIIYIYILYYVEFGFVEDYSLIQWLSQFLTVPGLSAWSR